MSRLRHATRTSSLRTLVFALPLLLFPAAAAVAIDVPTDTVNRPGAPPAPSPSDASAPAPNTGNNSARGATPVTTPATPKRRFYVVRVLKLGSRGTPVRQLQRKLRQRGQRFVKVDGVYGRMTRLGVRRVQRQMRMRVTGVADLQLLRRLRVRVRYLASRPAPTKSLTTPVRATTPVSGAKYLRAFPVVGKYTYTSDFGAPRHQGSHEGNDIMAARGTPVVAVADGRIKRLSRVETGLGGRWIWLQDTAGNEYYYAHLHTIAAGLAEGTRVRTGQVIGTVGNTGDARYGAPHLHFEIHPGGGGAVDPQQDLKAVERSSRQGR